MNGLFDRIRHGLRTLVRAAEPPRPERSVSNTTTPVPTPSRLRTELDAVDAGRASEFERHVLRHERALPPGSTRQRKANLSKARRVVPRQNALSIWGLSGPTHTSMFDEPATSERPPLFTGSTRAGRASQTTPAPPPVASDWTLQAPVLLSPQSDERREPPPLFGPADGLGRPDDRDDRPF